MGTRTALELVNLALQEIGLPQAQTLISPLDDQTGFQALGLLNALGRQLSSAHDWQFLEKTATITGDGVATSFVLPTNFERIVNQTQWSSRNKRPMFGPMSPQGWAWVQFGIVSVGVYYRYRILNNRLHIFPTPANGEIINFFYIQKNWVTGPAPGFVEKDRVEVDADVPIYDDYLLIAGLKFKIWSAKGMDTTELHREFMYMLDAEKAQATGAPVISLDRRWDHLYIGGQNVPDGGWNV